MRQPTRVALFDYGSGNLHSVDRALTKAGAHVVVTSSIHEAADCDGVVIPGVGAFSACMAGLRAARGDELIALAVARDQPLFGICVGHQILFGSGSEHGAETPGLNVFPGRVLKLAARRLPHMGWNQVRVSKPGSVLDAIDGESCYFVHSYAAEISPDLPREAVVGYAEHEGQQFCAAVAVRNIVSTQFHPEKSHKVGVALLSEWVSGCRTDMEDRHK